MTQTNQFIIEWVDGEKEPQCKPNPQYPHGIDLDLADRMGRSDEPCCTVSLPHPAKRIGAYHVQCRICKAKVACTTAGRPDDPRSIRFPCRAAKGSVQ